MHPCLREHTFPSGQKFQISQGDITQERVDAIVNAANQHLQHGGGVAGLIARKGGLPIQTESTEWVRQHGPVSHAEPAYTTAGNLPCKYVIHAVGPVWGSGDEDRKLAAAIAGSLRLADRLELHSLAFPAISTGTFGFPRQRAAHVIFAAIEQYFRAIPHSGVATVRLVLFDQPTVDDFLDIWDAQPGAVTP
jgi:O-acetyl-ADP-ribose deacetylase (regulator of RNase III)